MSKDKTRPNALRCYISATEPATENVVRQEQRNLALHSEREWLIRFSSWALINGYAVQIIRVEDERKRS